MPRFVFRCDMSRDQEGGRLVGLWSDEDMALDPDAVQHTIGSLGVAQRHIEAQQVHSKLCVVIIRIDGQVSCILALQR